MIFDPVECCVREYDVKATIQFNPPRVHACELQVRKPLVIEMSAGELDHLRRTIDTYDSSMRHGGVDYGAGLAKVEVDGEFEFLDRDSGAHFFEARFRRLSTL